MKILIGIDGSSHSSESIQFLSDFPFAEQPEVLLATVTHTPDLSGAGMLIPENVQEVIDDYRESNQKLLKLASASCQPWASHVTTHEMEGNAGKELLKLAEKEKVDLIVIGSRGLGSVDRFLLGSVSERVALYARCSVLVVRADAGGNGTECRSLLFADDGSEEITHAIDAFSKMPLGPDRQAVLVGVLEYSSVKGLQKFIEENPFWKEQAKNLEEHLKASVAKLEPTRARVQSLLNKAEKPSNEILAVAETYGTDLIVLGSHGKNAWERILLGSTTARIVRHAHCSVLIHRVRS